MSSPLELAPGALFAGEYTIVRAVAEGGMGGVYVATQRSTGRERALKVMHPWLVRDAASRARFEREARVGAMIASDHIVEVVASGVDASSGVPWLAMELLAGQTLTEHVASKGALHPNEARSILQQICHGLGAAHEKGLVHRDLKPDNVMVSLTKRSGQSQMVKLLDFGIAKLLQESKPSATATGAIGSPFWMAPEQSDEQGQIAPTTDVWALGLMTFWLLTGRIYWKSDRPEGPSMPSLLRQLHVDDIEPPSVRVGNAAGRLPAGFDGWFRRAVARDPAHRFPNAHLALDAFEALFETPAIGFAATAAALPVAASDGSSSAASEILTPPPMEPTPQPMPSPAFSPAVLAPARSPQATDPLPAAADPVAEPRVAPEIPRTIPPVRKPGLSGVMKTAIATALLAVIGAGAFLAYALNNRRPEEARHRAPDADPSGSDVAGATSDAGPSLVPNPDVGSASANPFASGQTWRGFYECPRGEARGLLHVRRVEGWVVSGIFEFLQPATDVSGQYHVTGTFAPATRQLRLQPGAWRREAHGYRRLTLDGHVDADGELYSGRVTGSPGCTTFHVGL